MTVAIAGVISYVSIELELDLVGPLLTVIAVAAATALVGIDNRADS
jgi:hypothetical protein